VKSRRAAQTANPARRYSTFKFSLPAASIIPVCIEPLFEYVLKFYIVYWNIIKYFLRCVNRIGAIKVDLGYYLKSLFYVPQKFFKITRGHPPQLGED